MRANADNTQTTVCWLLWSWWFSSAPALTTNHQTIGFKRRHLNVHVRERDSPGYKMMLLVFVFVFLLFIFGLTFILGWKEEGYWLEPESSPASQLGHGIASFPSQESIWHLILKTIYITFLYVSRFLSSYAFWFDLGYDSLGMVSFLLWMQDQSLWVTLDQ